MSQKTHWLFQVLGLYSKYEKRIPTDRHHDLRRIETGRTFASQRLEARKRISIHYLNGKGDNTMNLNPIKANMNEVDLGNGMKVLFSYSTAVAYKILGPCGMEYFVTEKFYSRTTSKHINAWMPKDDRNIVTQEHIDNLIAGVK
jgi:hypothetical protein